MKRAFQTLWIIVSVALVAQLVHSILDLNKRGSVVDEAKNRLEKVKKENTELKKQELYVQSQDYVEKQARDKLNLARKDEIVAIVQKITPSPTPDTQPDNKKNWQLWMDVFRIEL